MCQVAGSSDVNEHPEKRHISHKTTIVSLKTTKKRGKNCENYLRGNGFGQSPALHRGLIPQIVDLLTQGILVHGG